MALRQSHNLNIYCSSVKYGRHESHTLINQCSLIYIGDTHWTAVILICTVIEDNHYGYEGQTHRVPTSTGNHGKLGKSPKKVPCMEKSWNLKKETLNNHGKIMEFCEII